MLRPRLRPAASAVAVSAMAAIGLAVIAPAASAGPMPSGSASQIMSDLRNAWQITKGHGVTVAVLSTGVDPNAAGLAGKVTVGPDYVKLPHPGHVDGTLIASGIAGGADGTLVIAPQARILSVRVAPDGTEPGVKNYYDNVYTSDVLGAGIRYAVSHGAGVIYIDWVPTAGDTEGLESAVRYALSKDVLITAPALWNTFGGRTEMSYPAAIPGVMTATMVTLPAPAQSPAGSVGAAALDDSVLVAAPDNTVQEMGPGSSQPYTSWGYETAGAWIAGTAALIKSAYPDLPPALAARAIALSARYHPVGGYNVKVGFGLINPYGALSLARRLLDLAGAAGPAGLDPGARFGAAPAVVDAVHRSPAEAEAFGGLTAAGVVLLLTALWLALQPSRRGPRGPRSAREGA